jgi:predicted GNAT family acetyltransferase
MNKDEIELEDNAEKSRFQFDLDGQLGVVEYILVKDLVYITHTEVPEALGGRGYGSQIVKLALDNIKSRGLKLIPQCPFVVAYIEKNPQWQEIVDPTAKK